MDAARITHTRAEHGTRRSDAATPAASTGTSGGGGHGMIIAGATIAGLGVVATAASLLLRSRIPQRLAPAMLYGGIGAAVVGSAVLAIGAARGNGTSSPSQPAPPPATTTPPSSTTPAAPSTPTTTTVSGVTGDEGRGITTPPLVHMETVASDLGTLTQVTSAPGDDALWLVEKSGKLLRRAPGGEVSTALDITSLVSGSGERGLLSVAFHPDFATNGRLFIDYTDQQGDTHIAAATVGSGARVDPESLTDLMVIDQPYANHNGGQLQFGPDGMLYIGMGDGGSGGDPEDRAQDLSSHLGKILRIDVDHPSGGRPYGIPTDNPFATTSGAQPEIYSTGVRNPWRFSFDRATGDLWIGDVGQSAWEEVDFAPAGTARGANFGWDIREGAHGYEESAQAPGPVIDPALEYSHREGSSITGGYVYRGDAIPELRGYYVYADIARDTIRAVKIEDGRVVDRRELEGGRSMVVSFGEGPDHELYAVTISGELTRITSDRATGPGGATPTDEPPPSTGPASTVQIHTIPGAMRFDKEEYHVPAGTVTLHLTNDDDAMPHNIGVRNDEMNEMSDFTFDRGETVDLTVDLEPGTYELYCAPHAGMGMVARLVVDAP